MKEEDFRIIVLFLFAILVMLTIFVIQNCDKKDNIKLDYEIETYIDDEGIVYKILRDSNGDTVFVDKRYE